MKMILSTEQIRECEQFTMLDEPIKSIDLMERAAVNFTEKLKNIINLEKFASIVIFCGPGNNGGDGWAIARLLATENYSVVAIAVTENRKLSPDCEHNKQRFEDVTKKYSNATTTTFHSNLQLKENILIIDAIFGIGLSKPVANLYADAIYFINQHKTTVVSVDVPSGLYLDTHTPVANPCISATYTLTFQYMKQAFVMSENEMRVGQCVVVDIGLLTPDTVQPVAKMVDISFVSQFLKRPSYFAHKGSNGTGLLIAGSDSMPGAAVLASKAAMRGGIGKIVVHTSQNVATFVINALPEAVLDVATNETSFSMLNLEKYSINSVAIGPGIGTSKKIATILKNLIEEVQSPLILDADALNILAENKTWLAFLPQNSILTPHVKEFERLTHKSTDDFDRWQNLKEFAIKYEVVVILKGAYSLVALPDGKILVNSSGNPGMATAGSGDVLTGLLLASVAKGYATPVAAIISAFIHGLAGDLALKNQSFESLIATDIINNFGNAFRTIYYEN